MKKNVTYKQGLFDWDSLTVKFGGELSKPENIFTATAIKVPDYKYQLRERESLGGGWYGSMETNTYTADKVFLIMKEGECIGYMFHPYAQCHRIKTYLIPIDSKTPKPILDFIEREKITIINLNKR